MTSPIPPELSAQTLDNLTALRSQLAIIQNVLVSLNGQGVSSAGAASLKATLSEATDAADLLQKNPVSRASRHGSGKGKSSFSNGLIRYSQRQVARQIAKAIRQSIARDF